MGSQYSSCTVSILMEEGTAKLRLLEKRGFRAMVDLLDFGTKNNKTWSGEYIFKCYYFHNLQIDEDAVRGMTDSDLSEYLPKKGDRFALKDFPNKGLQKPKETKVSLMDRLRTRLQRNAASSADSNDNIPGPSVRKNPK